MDIHIIHAFKISEVQVEIQNKLKTLIDQEL